MSGATPEVPQGRRRGRPTKSESARLRQIILEVATDEFLTRGYSTTTVDGISERSKIGKMTIYRHFSSKEQLFRAVFVRSTAGIRNSFAKVTTRNRPIRDVVTDFIRASYTDPARGQLLQITRIVLAEAATFPDLAYAVYMHRRELIKPLTAYLEQMAELGVLRLTGGAELTAFELVSMASGGLRAMMLPQHILEQSRERWIEAATDIFLNGTLIRPGETGQEHGSAPTVATSSTPISAD